jgi:hypothetical protein
LEEAQVIIEVLWGRLSEALERIEQLEEQLDTDSNNSSKPPSSDLPQKRAKRRKKPRSSRSRGGQAGHPQHGRALMPEEQVDEVQRFFPASGCGCGGRGVDELEAGGAPSGVRFARAAFSRHGVSTLPR